MMEWNSQEGEGQRERMKRDILTEGAVKELARNMALGKFPGIHKGEHR